MVSCQLWANLGAYASRMEGEAANAAEEDVFEVLGRLCVMEDAPHPRRGWERMIAGVGKRLKRQPALPCKVLGGSWREEEFSQGGCFCHGSIACLMGAYGGSKREMMPDEIREYIIPYEKRSGKGRRGKEWRRTSGWHVCIRQHQT